MGLHAPDLHFQRLTRTHPYLALFSPSLSLVEIESLIYVL